jgi:hypothetical protein
LRLPIAQAAIPSLIEAAYPFGWYLALDPFVQTVKGGILACSLTNFN